MAMPTRKVEVNLGYACNAKCPFCYYYDSVITRTNEETLTTEEARQQLQLARKFGVKEIEFTGGEVTLRKDFVELVSYAKNELKFEIVSLITNGIKLSNKRYTASLAEAGLDDILFSLHGGDPETHDDITKVPQSFRRLLQGIDNAQELGLRVRTNSVVCKTNYKRLPELFRLLLAKKVDNINLVMFNPIIQAKNVDITEAVYVNYADAGQEIIRTIQMFEDQLPQFNVRYMPFCFLPGYEKYITNMDQMTFDPDEWDNYLSFRIRKGRLAAWSCMASGMLNIPYWPYLVKHGFRAIRTAALSRFYVLKDRVKARACADCAFENVCDYLYRDYVEHYGDANVVAIPGAKVSNPAWVMEAAEFRRPGSLPTKLVPEPT